MQPIVTEKTNRKYDPVSEDRKGKPEGRRAEVSGIVIPNPNTGERMSAALFTPRDEGKRPTILLLHGFPGDENNFDLAHVFQRAGYVVLVIHYRGTWGSEGLFSLSGVLEDVGVTLKFIREHSAKNDAFGFDAERLFLIGHSMGGFAALETAAKDHDLLGAAGIAAFDFSLAAKMPNLNEAMREQFRENLSIWRIGLDELMRQIDDCAEEWSFPSLAPGLSRLPVCLIGASQDEISLPKYHWQPLCEALTEIGGEHFTSCLLEAEHSLSDRRIELASILLRWANSLLESLTA